MVIAPRCHLVWPQYFRLINSAYPPIDLFEDIASPADWALLAQAESRTNPRLSESIGALDTIPIDRRVGGAEASYVMASFTYFSPDHPGRFDDGSFGAFYAADSYETALFETIHHAAIFCAATREEPGWIADKRELIGSVDAQFSDLRHGFPDLLDPDDYTASQAFARADRVAGSDGIVFASVRNPGGTCFAAFYPDVMAVPVQGRHISYHWNGERIDIIKDITSRQVFEVVE